MSDDVRQARQELMRVGLLGDVRTDGVVPDLIVRSWRRSISISADGANPCQRFTEIDTDSILCRAADPVLDRWQAHLADTGTTLFLSDRAGAIVARRASDSSVRRRLDNVHAAEGFDYSEESIGTNGLGTSMVEKRALLISGSQHYNDALATLACAAAPVCTPAGSVIGSISLGGPIESANPLMLSLTREIGQQIEERLRSSARPQDLALAMSFTRFTNSQRPTVVMDSESILANTPGLPYIDVTSHVMLWELLNSHDWTSSNTLRLQPDDTMVEVIARRVLDGPRAHFVLHFADLEQIAARQVELAHRTRCVPDRQRRREYWFRQCTVVDGPAGSGRATAAQIVCVRMGDGQSLRADRRRRRAQADWVGRMCMSCFATERMSCSGVRRTSPRPTPSSWPSLSPTHQSASVTAERTSALLLTADRDRCAPPVRDALDGIGYAARATALGVDARTHPWDGEAGARPGRPRRPAHHVARGAAVLCAVELAGQYDRTRRNADRIGQDRCRPR